MNLGFLEGTSCNEFFGGRKGSEKGSLEWGSDKGLSRRHLEGRNTSVWRERPHHRVHYQNFMEGNLPWNFLTHRFPGFPPRFLRNQGM